MRKWKIIFGLTISIISIFIIFSIIIAIIVYTNNAGTHYPRDNLGITVYNWFGTYYIYMLLLMYIFGIPLIIDVVLLIISIKKIKKKNL